VVDTAGDPIIAVLIASAAVTREVLARIGLEVGVNVALVVAIDRAHLAGPAIRDAEIAGGGAFLQLALGIDDLRDDAEERPRRGARFKLGGARQRRYQNAARLGLPPGVDDGATAIADHAMIPLPRFRIDRLADRAEEPQARARGALHRAVAGLHQRADRGRRGVEGVDLVLVDHLPEARHRWVVRHALEHQ